jgi:bacterioferritin-associated ferredoxin
MYVCFCKALTEQDVRDLARSLRAAGITSVESFLSLLDLDDTESCGLCADDPEPFVALALSEWAAEVDEIEDIG